MTEKEFKVNNKVHKSRFIEEYERYSDDFIESATVRPEKYHILEQIDNEDCIITTLHQIINSDYLDLERELINGKLLNSSNYDSHVFSEYEISKQFDSIEESNESSCEDDADTEMNIFDEEDEDENNNEELLLLLRGTERSKKFQRKEILSLPSSDFLIVKNFPISFGIPVVTLQKLNIKPIMLIWIISLFCLIYGISVFLDEYVINDIIPLYPLNNIFEDNKENDNLMSSFLRSKNSTMIKNSSYYNYRKNSILKKLFPSFINMNNNILNYDQIKPLNISLDIKHCHIQFLNSTTNLSYIKVRSWRLFSQSHLYSGSNGRYRILRSNKNKYDYICSHNTLSWILKRYLLPWENYNDVNIKNISWRDYKEYCDSSSRPWNFLNDSNLLIKLHQSNIDDYFQCSINFFLSNDFTFNDISIKFVPSSSYMKVFSNVPIYANSAFHLEALHGIFDLKEIHSPNISITLSDGWASFNISEYNKDNNNRNILIESRGAPIYINSRIPLVVALPTRIAELSIFRSKYIKVQLDRKFGGFNNQNYYKSDTVIANLNIDSSFYDSRVIKQYTRVNVQGSIPPIYINVNNNYEDNELLTWAGRNQWKDPHLLRFSKTRFDNFSKWLQEDLASPWVLHINILGNNDYPKGTWKAVSSRAFIRDAYGLVLLSGGLLSPRVYNLFIHILGLKCLVPINHSDLEDLDVINVDGNNHNMDNISSELVDNTIKNTIDLNKTNNNINFDKRKSIFSNITQKFNEVIYSNNSEPNSKEKMKLINLKNIFNNNYKSKMFLNNLQESFYFDNNGNDDYYNQNFNAHEGNSGVKNIEDIGNYIGKSSSLGSCESSITENIFSVINSAILDTAQQPNVIVWTQSDHNQYNISNNNIRNLEICKFSFKWIILKIKNKFQFILSIISAIFRSIENFLFPSWIIPGWSNLSKKIIKSSLLADDDFILNPDIFKNRYQQNVEQFIYTAENDAILRDLVTANDLQGYIISLSLNITCAILVAAVAMWVLYYYVFPWFLTGIREMQLVSTASHRLNHDFRTSEAAEWIVMVSTIQWPSFGLLLRWNQRQKRRDNEKLCIYIKQVETANNFNNNNPSEFFLYIPANEASLTTHLGRNQQELFVPMKYSDKCIFEVTMPYELISDRKYRLRILRISSSGHIIEQSNWSNEIIPGNKMKFVDFPLLFLRRFLPKKRSSLNLFIDKNTNHYSPFGIPFHFKDIEIIIFDVLGGKKKKKNSIFHEFDEYQDDSSSLNQNNKFDDKMTNKKFESNLLNYNSNKLSNESSQIKSFYHSHTYNEEITGFGSNHNDINRRHKYLLVAKLVSDSNFNDGNAFNGMSGVVDNNYNGNNSNPKSFNSKNIPEDDNSESLKNYTFKNKSFNLDKVRIEGNLENINLYDNDDNFDQPGIGSGNVYILRNRADTTHNSENKENKNCDDSDNGLYLEQSLISQKRILFELQEADSGQVIANGDVKCSKLIDIAWKSLINNFDEINIENNILSNDIENNKTQLENDIQKNIKSKYRNNKNLLDSHIIQVHDTISNDTISINKFVDISIKLYYVEGGQWGELSMLLDRSFWVQYLRHDLSQDIILDLDIFNNIESLNIEMITKNSIENKSVDNLETEDDNATNNSIINRVNDTNNRDYVTKPRFIYDTPGKVVINGSDIQIKWIWRESKKENSNYVPKKLYLHLFDHCTDTHLASLHGERSIPNTGTYAWSVDVPFISQRSSSRDVYLVMSVSKEDIPSNVAVKGKMFVPRNSIINSNRKNTICNKQIIVAVSNSFTIIRLTTLSEFELLYATFCRTYGLEMEVVTYSDLSKYGFLVSTSSLRVCDNIRKPIPTETHQSVTYCPGQYIISAKALAVVTENISESKNNENRELENCIFLKSQRKSVNIIENCTLNYSTYWWSSSPDRFLLKNGIILDTSIFLPLTIKIISCLKIDSIMLFLRNFSITRTINSLISLKKKFRFFNKIDEKFNFRYQENDEEIKTINISSGLLVHSNYSTVFRRKSTWRSGRFKIWKAILSFVNSKEVSKISRKRSKDTQNISKSKRRWSNALLSLKIAHIKHSPSFSIKNLKKGISNSSLDYSSNSIRNSNCDYIELAAITNINKDENQMPPEDNFQIQDHKYDQISGYNIGYGGILVPIYIAKIKQRQEIIHEIWYFIQFSMLPILLNIFIYSFQISLLSIFPITCIILTLIYNYLSTFSVTAPHSHISSKYISDIVFNPTWNFFMSIPFPVPHLILSSILHLLIIHITFIASNSSKSSHFRNENENKNSFLLINKLNYYWFKLLIIFEDIGMFVTIFSTFLTLLAISMFFLWFLLGSLINSDNILPYVVMLLALGFVIVSLWNNFSSSRGIVDRFIAENLQSLISIALGHWFEATNQTFTNNSNSTDPNDLIAAASEQLQSEITNYRCIWAKAMLNNNVNANSNDNRVSSKKFDNKKQLLKDYLDGSMELHRSTRIKSVNSKLINDYSSVYCSKWEYLKINPVNPKNLFGVDANGEIIGVQDTLKMYYGMKLATKTDVLAENDKVDSLLEGFDVALLQDGLKYGPRFGYKVDNILQHDTWYKCAIVKVPIFPPSESLPDEAKVKLIFDFFDMDEDGYLNREEFLYWVVNLHYDRFFFNGINTKYNEIVDYFNSICNTNVDEKLGFTVEDIIILYSLYPGNLDSDYEKVIPIRNSNESEINGNSSLDQFQFDRDDRYMLDNNIEEEYDDEFSNNLFTLNSNLICNKISNIDQKGYLWLDLLSINNSSFTSDNMNMNDFYIGRMNSSEIGTIVSDLSNLKLCSLHQINKMNSSSSSPTYCDNDLNIENSSGLLIGNQTGNNKSNIRNDLKTKYTKSQLLREINVQKLKYIFTFATRNLRTPDIETALKDVHSLAYKVFDAQIALLIPIFGKKNVLSFINNSLQDDTINLNINNSLNENTTANDNKNIADFSYEDYSLNNSSSTIEKRANYSGISNRYFSLSSSNWMLNSMNNSNRDSINQSKNDDNDTTKFLQLMRILHNEIKQDILLLFNHIIGRLFNKSRVRKGANYFFDIVYPKLIRRKAARIVNIFYGPSLNELSLSIHEYFVSAPPKTAAQVVDALKEYRVENQTNVKDTLEIISLSQGNASIQFQVSLITKALYAISVLKDTDVEMLTVDIPWKRSHSFITEEVLILPRNHQGMKVILGAIQTVLRRATSITSNKSSVLISEGTSTNVNNSNVNEKSDKRKSIEIFQNTIVDSKLNEFNNISNNNINNVINEFTETTLEQVIQVIVSQYLWMDAFIFLIRLCGINLSTDRLPTVTYDNSVSLTNLNYVEEKNLQHVKNIFTKLSNGSGFLPVELSDLALQTLTDKCLNFSGLLVSMHFLGLISNNMFVMGIGSPMNRLKEVGLNQNINVLHIHKNTNFNNILSNIVELSEFSSINKNHGNTDNLMWNSGFNPSNIGDNIDLGNFKPDNTRDKIHNNASTDNLFNKVLPERCSNYGELLDWTLLNNIKGIPDDIIKDFRRIAVLRCGFIGRSQLHDYIRYHKRLYMNNSIESNTVNEMEKVKFLSLSRSQSGNHKNNLGDDNNNHASNDNDDKITQENAQNRSFNKSKDDYFEKMTGKNNKSLDFNISFDIFDTTLTTLGFSSHKLQSYILWLLLCLNLKMDNVQPFVNASLARDFIIMVYLQPIYKNSDQNINNTQSNNKKISESSCKNTNHNKINSQNNNINNSQHRSSIFDINFQNKHFDAQDVHSYQGYFTHEMLRRFLALAKITLPNSGVEAIWRSLPKDPLNITSFIIPFRNSEEENNNSEVNTYEDDIDFYEEFDNEPKDDDNSLKNKIANNSKKKITKRRSLGDRFRKDKKSFSLEKLEDNEILLYTENTKFKKNSQSKESVHLRILMDPTGMDPMEGIVINIDSVRRLLPKKLMTGLWPEAIKVVLNIGLHLEKPDSSIIEATSKCLECSNRYGLIRPGDMVSILAALSKEGLSFDLLCELLNNMRIQLPVREVKRMFDLMDLNQDKSLDLQELLDGFEVLFGLFLPQLVHVHVGLSYERQGLIIIAASASLLLFCAFVGIAIKTFEGMRNELSTAVQSVLAIVGAVGLQTGASQDSKEIEERMKERIEDIMGGDIETSVSQVELNENSEFATNSDRIILLNNGNNSRIITRNKNVGINTNNYNNNNLMILTEKGPILKIGYSLPSKYRSDINDPRPCITFYTQDQVYLEPLFYCTKGVINQQHNIFLFNNINKRWYIKPSFPKYIGLNFSAETGIIHGTIPTHSQNKIGYIRRISALDNERYSSIIRSSLNANSTKLMRKLSNIKSSSETDFNKYNKYETSDINDFTKNKSIKKTCSFNNKINEDIFDSEQDNNSTDHLAKELLNNKFHENVLMPYGGQLVQMNRKTFTVYCIITEFDEKIVFKTRVTFQIIPRTRIQNS